MCRRIAEVCGIHEDDTILDFGCARGYVVKAFRELGFRALGIDASEWAIANCDPDVEQYVHQATRINKDKDFDWIIAKDVLEHIPDSDLPRTIENLLTHARKGLFVVVPLSPADGEPYVVPEYEKDITHVQHLALGSWSKLFQRHDFCISACYRVRGIKENYYKPGWEEANGFIFCRRGSAGEE